MITSVNRPYRRTIRQFRNGSYGGGFVLHEKYAQSPELSIRSFLILQKDLQNLFDYIEPANANLDCYSYRIHELLTRSCIEIESNFKDSTKLSNWGSSFAVQSASYAEIENSRISIGIIDQSDLLIIFIRLSSTAA